MQLGVSSDEHILAIANRLSFVCFRLCFVHAIFHGCHLSAKVIMLVAHFIKLELVYISDDCPQFFKIEPRTCSSRSLDVVLPVSRTA